jgi:3-methyl-2-oxobutanoate hydroxymethyltransferase
MNAPVTLTTLQRFKASGEKIACVTAYDASFTCLLEEAGADVLLVGDSLGNVIQGHDSTLPVSMEAMVYHAACVARAGKSALRIVDMPFMSYATIELALRNAGRLMGEGGAHMVKLEGGRHVVDTVRALTDYGVPVCAHLGLTPQSVHRLGGYRVQGRDPADATRLLEDARLLDETGACALVLECIPSALAAQVSAAVSMPTIGIGAGARCDGQVLVLYDLLGITPGRPPTFSRNFLRQAGDVPAALRAYVKAVKDGSFPAPEHSFE